MSTKSNAKALSVEVIKPGGCLTVRQLEETEIVKQIAADHEACERSSRVAAFAALRNGIRLVWVRDNGSGMDADTRTRMCRTARQIRTASTRW